MDITERLSVNNDITVIRKFNDEYYTATQIKGYFARKKRFREFDWQLYGGEFKEVISVTKKIIKGVSYFADVDGNLLHDKYGQIRFFEDFSHVNHSDKKLEQSLSRSKRMIHDLIICNDWDYFITFTGNDKLIDRFSVEAFKTKWKKFIKAYNQSPRNADFKIKYLIVPEWHKNKAIHFHGVLKGGHPDDYFINENGYLDFKPIRDNFGWYSASKIKAQNKIANYITKYISKDLASCIDLSKNCYLCSQKLKRPEIVIYGDNISVGDKWDFENEHIKKNVYHDDSFLTDIEIM